MRRLCVSAVAMLAFSSFVAITAPVAATANGARVGAGGTRLNAFPGSTSANWSGYAGILTSGKLTYTSATWKVPAVAKVNNTFSSTWVGIDGDGNSSLIQTGTEQDYAGGRFVYRAWWEILPAPETIIPSLKISPGDVMSGSVRDSSGTKWTITLTDVTKGKSFSINVNYNGPGKSAEWIQEAPSNSTGILNLAHYGQTYFKKALIGINFGAAHNPQLSYPGMAIAMVQHGKQVSTPSKPSGGNSFNVRYGATQPPPP